jgi:hypothetical protein
VAADVDSAVPHLAPPREPGRDSWLLLEQQLADLEIRRQALSERLMPEHPQMKALDQKMSALRTRLADQPPPTHTPPHSRTAALPPIAALTAASEHGFTAHIAALADDLAAAQSAYETAAAQERATWQAMNTRAYDGLVELEPATTPPPAVVHGGQYRLIASLCGLMSFALVLAFWPKHRLTFSSVEEVRAVTRLPVVAVSRRSLN